ncbi:hypothetical protein AOQ84DRAFT_373002 [Glonium stellatum]|uniref:Uncharacterized protein n=1 Tax=Glonium stellatum TaxID=574774 RepID=A0A8E2F8S1_9PEZI|nr:hypothetical protein AOQ84DRAFT_373002 [Glonium stellatum]
MPTFGSFLNAVFTTTEGSFPSTSPAPITTTSGPGTRPVTSSLFSTPTSSASATPGPSQKSNTSTIVGAAVGVPVGFLALAGLVYLLLRERRRRISAESTFAKVSTPPMESAAMSAPLPPPLQEMGPGDLHYQMDTSTVLCEAPDRYSRAPMPPRR